MRFGNVNVAGEVVLGFVAGVEVGLKGGPGQKIGWVRGLLDKNAARGRP
jgi:hypothetical protein